MRGLLATTLALLLATQGAQAAGRSFSHSGARAHSGVHHFHSNVIAKPVRVVPRYVYVAPYVPYYSTPYYSSPSYYYPSASYAAPAYYPPDSPSYIEAPQQYAPPPPPPSAPAQPAAHPGPYSMEQGTQYRYLCLDTRRFYPDTKECPSGWLTVLPGARNPER
jgi:hypothetical protein